jgi:DNA-binding IclR family transcriptional regulator
MPNMIPSNGTGSADAGDDTTGGVAAPLTGAETLQPGGVTSVDKALRLLLLMREEGPISVSRAGEALDVARSTAHRLLTTLQARGFAHQDPLTRAYGPGRELLRIGLAAVGGLDIRRVAHPYLLEVVKEVQETVHLIALDGPRTLVLDSVECNQEVRVGSRIGGSQPPNCTSAGKALLARMSPEQVVALLGPDPLETLTPYSIRTHAELALELERVRELGYATNFGGNDLQAANVAVAIPSDRGGRRAAITVSAPAQRMTERQIPHAVAAARAAAERIAQELEGRS